MLTTMKEGQVCWVRKDFNSQNATKEKLNLLEGKIKIKLTTDKLYRFEVSKIEQKINLQTMTLDEKIKMVEDLKSEADQLFKKQKYDLASQKYGQTSKIAISISKKERKQLDLKELNLIVNSMRNFSKLNYKLQKYDLAMDSLNSIGNYKNFICKVYGEKFLLLLKIHAKKGKIISEKKK